MANSQHLYPQTSSLTDNGPAVITDQSGNGINSGGGGVGFGGGGMMSATVAPMPQHPQQQLQIVNPSYGPRTMSTICPSCHQQQWTKVEYTSNTKTHIIALLLCGLCCCCIPYCMDSCKNVNHHCSQCGAYLGTYKN